MSTETNAQLQLQRLLLENLQHPNCFDHEIEQFQLIETHISWVLLTGNYAYKMKKAVNFGFLDYATLEKRELQCREELRLNRRTAPDIYLDVIPVGGSVHQPAIDQQPAIEYLVKMKQFPQSTLLSQRLLDHQLNDSDITSLAQAVAHFHAAIEVAGSDSDFGNPQQVIRPIRENFEQISARVDEPALLKRLQQLAQQVEFNFQQLHPILENRKADGFIRDCHGDLHLNNVMLLEEKPLLFDCIEFNPSLRIIDVISEIAFLVMDLEEHDQLQHANLLLNQYLEQSGDYHAIPLLKFYLCYRAM
ncbi:MAG: phosphotransferase, partial [Gammaproteobacteria bacterium]|nr:phosphotransferase [Gammaproteobacteria bacterium]